MTPADARPLRVGVVGGGLIAQAIHLPNLMRLSERYRLAAIADPSRRVREALAAKYGGVASCAGHREMLERPDLDAVLVCSPSSTHAEVVLDALDRGLHVFVEKPLCVVVEDAARIADAAETSGLVVQVGYMKRYTAGYRALLEELPARGDGLQLIDIVCYDPWLSREPFVRWEEMVHGDDVPAAVVDASRRAVREQVEQAVGRGDDATVRGFSYTFLDCLVHDVNLVHGVLARLGVDHPLESVSGAVWGDGEGASATQRLPSGGVFHCTWMLLRGLAEFREDVRLHFTDAVHRLEVPAPYLVAEPIVHSIVDSAGGSHRRRREELVSDPFIAELEHFYDCVTQSAPCHTPPQQALVDLEALRDMFLHSREDGST